MRFVANSPFIGPKIPVSGLLLEVETGKLNWVVDGYGTLQTNAPPVLPGNVAPPKFGDHPESLGAFKDFATTG